MRNIDKWLLAVTKAADMTKVSPAKDLTSVAKTISGIRDGQKQVHAEHAAEVMKENEALRNENMKLQQTASTAQTQAAAAGQASQEAQPAAPLVPPPSQPAYPGMPQPEQPEAKK